MSKLTSNCIYQFIALLISFFLFVICVHTSEQIASTSTSGAPPTKSHAHSEPLPELSDLLDMEKYDIVIENTLDNFQESPLDMYFPVILANNNVVYCQNLKKEDSNSQNSRKIVDSVRLKDEVHETIKLYYPKSGKKCSMLRSGWWDYEFCFPNLFRQFHQNDDGTIPFEYILGEGDVDEVDKTIYLDISEPTNSYIEYVFKNGSICAVTNEPREVHVHFYCNSQQPRVENYFGNIIEPKSCYYIASFFMKKLCEIPGFKQADSKSLQCIEKASFQKFIKQLHDLNADLDSIVLGDTHSGDSTSDKDSKNSNMEEGERNRVEEEEVSGDGENKVTKAKTENIDSKKKPDQMSETIEHVDVEELDDNHIQTLEMQGSNSKDPEPKNEVETKEKSENGDSKTKLEL